MKYRILEQSDGYFVVQTKRWFWPFWIRYEAPNGFDSCTVAWSNKDRARDALNELRAQKLRPKAKVVFEIEDTK